MEREGDRGEREERGREEREDQSSRPHHRAAGAAQCRAGHSRDSPASPAPADCKKFWMAKTTNETRTNDGLYKITFYTDILTIC